MPTSAPGTAKNISVWSLRVVLGLIFAYVGVTKLTGIGNTPAYFAAIGWGQWLRYATGAVDLAGAVLLFVPRWTCYGAAMLACSVGLAALISATVLQGNPNWGGPIMVAIPLIMTSLAILLAWLTAPSNTN